MGVVRNIKQIKTWNRDDCCGARLTNYQVRIGNNADIWQNPACPGVYTGAQTINCEQTGRYLGITIPGAAQTLTLCEVEAYETIPTTQLRIISAEQSSNYDSSSLAIKAVDGNKNCNWNGQPNNALSCTNPAKNSWWNGDLGGPKQVKQITVLNRADCCQDRLNNFEIRVGDDANPLNNPSCGGIYSGSSTINCDLKGRYVGVILTGTNYLTLCEVEVFGI